MSRLHNLAVFFDGTWNDVASETNVWQLRRDVRLGEYAFEGEEDVYETEAFYATGPGTAADMAVVGGAFATDLGDALVDAYAWTCEKVLDLRAADPDAAAQLFVFGFSRGAYRAHAFTWLLQEAGVAQDFAVCRDAARRWVGHDLAAMRRLTEPAGVLPAPKVEMLGVWDVVTAPLDVCGNFHDGERAPLVAHLFHAMAANERRLNFPVMQYDPRQEGTVQTWFSGAHSDVGGGYPPGERLLSDVARDWMKRHAMACGLDFLTPPPEVDAAVDFAHVPLHDEASPLAPAKRVFRDGEHVHASVAARRAQDAAYRMDVLDMPAVYDAYAAPGATFVA